MLAGTDPEKRPKFVQSKNQHDSWFSNMGKISIASYQKIVG
jgi:hypothetical protein